MMARLHNAIIVDSDRCRSMFLSSPMADKRKRVHGHILHSSLIQFKINRYFHTKSIVSFNKSYQFGSNRFVNDDDDKFLNDLL